MRNSFTCNEDLTTLVDQGLGNAFPIVREVYKNLQHLVYLAINLNQLRPKDVEFQVTDNTFILQWRYVGETEWNFLMDLHAIGNAELILQSAEAARDSALHSATSAAVSESNASGSEIRAKSSENNSQISETNSKTSEINAATSAATAVAAKNEAQATVPPVQLATYADLRAYTGTVLSIIISGFLVTTKPSGISGTFVRNDSVVNGIDDGGLRIIDGSGRAWDRVNPLRHANVLWWGAVSDNIFNCSPAFQGAVNSKLKVYIPYSDTQYYLATPVLVDSGTVIEGGNGFSVGYFTGAFVRPETIAFRTKDYLSQLSNVAIHNVGFLGGTTQVDLGCFHEVDITCCWFRGFSKTGLVIVRGEKHRLERLRFEATIDGVVGMSIGRWQESESTGYSDSWFGSPGSWFDRASLKDIHFQTVFAGFAWVIKANIISGSTIMNVVHHGVRSLKEQGSMYVRDRIQQTEIMNFAPDSVGVAGGVSQNLFDIGQTLGVTFTHVSPQFAGNNTYVRGFNIGSANQTTWEGCRSDGDNITQFGWYFGTANGQTAVLNNCRGSLYSASTSALVRGQIIQRNCVMSADNTGGVMNSNTTNMDMLVQLMADTNGTLAATSRFGVQFAIGSGNNRVPFYVRADGVWASQPIKFTNQYGETYPQSIAPGNVVPEGAITANPGSQYMYYNGTSTGKLYVKETGTGNTGWVAK